METGTVRATVGWVSFLPGGECGDWLWGELCEFGSGFSFCSLLHVKIIYFWGHCVMIHRVYKVIFAVKTLSPLLSLLDTHIFICVSHDPLHVFFLIVWNILPSTAMLKNTVLLTSFLLLFSLFVFVF